MNFCHYIKDKGCKILIPHCYSVVHSNDIEDCTCPNPLIKNKKIRIKQNEIDRLKSEIKTLEREIENIKLGYDLKLKK